MTVVSCIWITLQSIRGTWSFSFFVFCDLRRREKRAQTLVWLVNRGRWIAKAITETSDAIVFYRFDASLSVPFHRYAQLMDYYFVADSIATRTSVNTVLYRVTFLTGYRVVK